HQGELAAPPRRRRMAAFDVLEHQRHPPVEVERGEQPGRGHGGGQRGGVRGLGAVDAGGVGVRLRADRFDEGAAAVAGDQPDGRARGEAAVLGDRPGHGGAEEVLGGGARAGVDVLPGHADDGRGRGAQASRIPAGATGFQARDAYTMMLSSYSPLARSNLPPQVTSLSPSSTYTFLSGKSSLWTCSTASTLYVATLPSLRLTRTFEPLRSWRSL